MAAGRTLRLVLPPPPVLPLAAAALALSEEEVGAEDEGFQGAAPPAGLYGPAMEVLYGV